MVSPSCLNIVLIVGVIRCMSGESADLVTNRGDLVADPHRRNQAEIGELRVVKVLLFSVVRHSAPNEIYESSIKTHSML
jgi:hypothetical protein